MNPEYFLLIGSLLLLISIILSKTSHKLGVPSLLFFLLIGMLAGSEGIGGIYFDNSYIVQFVGIIALIFILFFRWTGYKVGRCEACALEGCGPFHCRCPDNNYCSWILHKLDCRISFNGISPDWCHHLIN